MQFSKKEIVHIVISALVLAFIFGFNDKQSEFVLSRWLANYVLMLMISSIILVIYEATHKIMAKRYYADTEYEIWSITKFRFLSHAKFPKKIFSHTINSFPLGIMISVLATLISNGVFYMTLLSSFKIIEKPHLRLGSKFINITYFERAKIASSAVIALILFAALASTISGGRIGEQFTFMVFVFIGYNLLPISSLDGSKIFFGSLPLYIGMIVFSAVSYALISVFSILAALILSMISALFIVFLYLGIKKF